MYTIPGMQGACLRIITPESPWYPFVAIPVGVHSPLPARLGHASHLKIGALAGPLYYYCSE